MSPMTLQEAAAHVSASDPRFAVEEQVIRGETYRVFREAPPSLPALMEASRAIHADGDYLVYEGERWSYEAFRRDVRRIAASLRDGLGVRKGDRVALAMRNYPEMLIAMMAIASTGAVVVFMNAWWTEEELAYAFEDSAAKIVFADGPRPTGSGPSPTGWTCW